MKCYIVNGRIINEHRPEMQHLSNLLGGAKVVTLPSVHHIFASDEHQAKEQVKERAVQEYGSIADDFDWSVFECIEHNQAIPQS